MLMLFRSKRDTSEVEKMLDQSRRDLQSAVLDLTNEIGELKNRLDLKEQRIAHLEALIRSGEIYADGDTGLLNKKYYEEYISPTLDNNMITITFVIRKFDGTPKIIKYRRDLSRALIQFCSNTQDTAILWEQNVIKVFLKVSTVKMDIVKTSITALLQQYIDINAGSLEIGFKNIEQDPDIGIIYWKR